MGQAIANDVKVFSDFVFKGVKLRDTRMHEPYRAYATGSQRLAKLKVLAADVLNWDIQGEDQSSVEDAQATMLLYRDQERQIEAGHGYGAYCGPNEDKEALYDVIELEGDADNEVSQLQDHLNKTIISAAETLQPTPAATFW